MGQLRTDLPPPNAASSYLEDAAIALTHCGSAPALYGGMRDTPNKQEAEHVCFNRIGPDSRSRYARSSILFSAFAAEAYVNGFLRQHLADPDFTTIDKLPTVEKYALITRLVAG